ncbi:MAG TPA: oxidoreductase [Lentisphaeria bacterium]|nr:oxidoreductase [Lentisphaeria bacterium]
MNIDLTRKKFIGSSAAAATTFMMPRFLRAKPTVKKLRLACIGVGGMGNRDVMSLQGETVVGLCDVDPRALKNPSRTYPSAKTYSDFRVMLRELKDEIDAVTVSTPDHTHFPASIMALQMGKHLYVQKPMAHTVEEVRLMMAEAKEQNVVTQMGNQGHALQGIRLIREWIEAGLIGDVSEVTAWTDRPKTGYGFLDKEQLAYPPAQLAPDTLDWDLWTGPVQDPPGYAPGVYHPKHWRGWWKFGMGGLGDIGCHTLDSPFWALNLNVPHKVEVTVDHVNPIFTPAGSVVTFHCRQKESETVIPVTWHEGPSLPKAPAAMGAEKLSDKGGLMIIGSKGVIYHADMRPDSPRLFPEELWQNFRTNPDSRPPAVYPRIKGGHRAEWLRACKGEGPTPGANFEYSGPLTEMIVLGTLAIRTGKGFEYDAENVKISNNPEANALLRIPGREGFRPEDLRG